MGLRVCGMCLGRVWEGWGRRWGEFVRASAFEKKFECEVTGQNEIGPADCAQLSAAPPQVAPRAGFQIQVLAKYLQA